MGGKGSGRWKSPRRRIVESCWVLDANHLQARGCLQPGGLGTLPWTDGDRVYSINLRYEAGQLYLSWRSHITGDGEQGEMIEVVPIVRPDRPCALPVRRHSPLFPLSRSRQDCWVWAACAQAVPRTPLFPVPAVQRAHLRSQA